MRKMRSRHRKILTLFHPMCCSKEATQKMTGILYRPINLKWVGKFLRKTSKRQSRITVQAFRALAHFLSLSTKASRRMVNRGVKVPSVMVIRIWRFSKKIKIVNYLKMMTATFCLVIWLKMAKLIKMLFNWSNSR